MNLKNKLDESFKLDSFRLDMQHTYFLQRNMAKWFKTLTELHFLYFDAVMGCPLAASPSPVPNVTAHHPVSQSSRCSTTIPCW